jgi:hypothetical protein
MLVSLLLAHAALCAELSAQEIRVAAPAATVDAQSNILLLQDGGVLTGQISHEDSWYVVGRAGGQLQVAESRVLFVGHTVRDAYDFRRTHLHNNTVEAHLELAEWCLRYSLTDEASSELAAAKTLGPEHPKLQLLERRLAASKEHAIQLASPAAPKDPPAANAAQTSPLVVTPDLPNGALEMFTRKVQPVLVNNCTVSKCHEPGGPQSFQLNRAVLRGEANRRTTMQNLSAALAIIDREHPEKSELLTVPRQTHGGTNGPIFGARQEQAFKHLADWVAIVSLKPTTDPVQNPADSQLATSPPIEPHKPKPRTIAAGRPTAVLSPTRAGLQLGTSEMPDTPQPSEPIVEPAVEPTAATDEPVKTLRQPHRLKYGGTAEKWQPRDPFDPEIFNRRQHPAAPTQPATPEAQ